MAADAYIIVAKIGKAFGLNGWVKLICYTQPSDRLLDYSPLFIQQADQWQTLNYDGLKQRGKDVLLHLSDCQTPEQTVVYRHALIGILRQQLPPLAAEEYYWTDLQGLKVVNQQGIELGIIDHLLETASNDILVVKGQRTYCIPYIRPQFVLSIDLDAAVMQVDWDEDF